MPRKAMPDAITRAAAVAYVGRAECGHIVFAAVDSPEHKKGTARDVAKAIRDGLTIEKMTVAEVRASNGQWCPKDCRQKRKARRADG